MDKRDAQRAAARDDRHLAHRIGAGLQHAEQRVAGFVVGGAAAFVLRNHDVARRAELHLLQRVRQIALDDVALSAARGQQRRLVHQIRQVGAGHARRRRGELVEVDVRAERHLARVDPQDLAARPLWSGGCTDDLPIEPAGPKQRRIEDVGTVGGGQHDHPLVPEKPSISVRIWFSVCSRSS